MNTKQNTTVTRQIPAENLGLLPRGHGARVRLRLLTTAMLRALKRCFDVLAAILLLVLFSPVFLVTALAITMENHGPVFFTQVRIGRNGRPFDFYKFRSMVVDAEKRKGSLSHMNESADGILFKIRNDPRVTRVGRFIRKYSIDELPQLLNVLKGDMSLVGPRPALPEEVARYTLDQRKRLHVLPGITCIWQVSGRSDIPFRAQVGLDLEYIGKEGPVADLVILMKTIPAVITGKGAG